MNARCPVMYQIDATRMVARRRPGRTSSLGGIRTQFRHMVVGSGTGIEFVMNFDTTHLEDLAGHRLSLQRNYEPKLRGLVETRSAQLAFDDFEREAALRSINALVWKLTAAGIHLERLWENHESLAMQQLMTRALRGNPDPKRFTEREVAFLTAEFEAYLVQARSFISVAQIHTLDACRVRFGGQLTNEKYDKAVRDAPKPVSDRLTRAHNFFTQDVFGPSKWGTLLQSLRNRVLHFDRVRPSRITSGEGLEELTVTGLSLETLAQDFENGAYDVLVNVIAPIWEREWLPGPYRPGMWE